MIPQETQEQSAVALGAYELVGKLARGGMGTVYVARRAGAAGFQRLFAIKLMHDHLADHDEFVQMFLDEARIAARLHHPNVVPIVDVGEVDGRQFVVMDYIEGCSLNQLFGLSPDNRPIKCVVKIFVDCLMGLHSAHQLNDDDGSPLNLVHRDVSPQNILIGVDGVTRITDFGIAKAEARLTSTRPGLRKGKLAFMAPEQLYDQGLDRRADIFSAGAVLWSALTGDKLFSGNSDAATMRNLLQLEIPPPSEVGLKPPPYLDDICLRALSREADARFQTAGAMAEAMREAAIKHNIYGSEADVAAWIKTVAGDRLQERRGALSATSSMSSIGSMPALVETGMTGLTGVTGATGMAVKQGSHARRKDRGFPLWLLVLLLLGAVVGAVVVAALTYDSGTGTVVEPSAPATPEAPGQVVNTNTDGPAARGNVEQTTPVVTAPAVPAAAPPPPQDTTESAPAAPGTWPAPAARPPRVGRRWGFRPQQRVGTPAAASEESVAATEPDVTEGASTDVGDASPATERPTNQERPARPQRNSDPFDAFETNPYTRGR